MASYQAAYDLGRVKLAPTSTTFLGLALNFAVFYYEMLEDPASAHKLARRVGVQPAMTSEEQTPHSVPPPLIPPPPPPPPTPSPQPSLTQTFENAIRALDDAGDDSYGDATMVLQLLRDNMTLWMSDLEERDESTL